MEVHFVKYCDQCNRSVVTGQRYYKRLKDGYIQHFHIELFVNETQSCWEKRKQQDEEAYELLCHHTALES